MERLSDSSDNEEEVVRAGFGGGPTKKLPEDKYKIDEPEKNLEDYNKRSSSSDTDPVMQIDNKSHKMTNKTDLKSTRKRGHLDPNSAEIAVPPTKKNRSTAPDMGGSTAAKIMAKMGYETGTGLGKSGQGRTEPVEMSTQRGRRGLGLCIPGLDAASEQWDPLLEEIKVQEDMDWLFNTHYSVPTRDDLQDWLGLGPKKLVIDDELSFCSKDVLKDVLTSKSVFDKLDGNELRKARTRCNPYETIRGAFFQNRAAVKMANIDKACDFIFTEPKDLLSNELLYFADVCAGPGGFSEYVLWKKKWHAKGFGFTLKGDNDFKLDEFYAGPCETFHPYYGPKEDGNVYDPQNQKGFRDLIMEDTKGRGVNFMMADGGFSIEGEENIQEILSKQLYLCQCLVALMIVKDGGYFVVKLFDLFTHFSAGLVYLMYRCFDKICIFKPNSSRPANSERYLICFGKRPEVSDVVDYLSQVNHHLLDHRSKDDDDVLQLVSPSELDSEKKFKDYLIESNNKLGRKQVIGLVKIAAFCNDPTLIETTQAEMRNKSLAYWELPLKSRTTRKPEKPHDRLQNLITNNTLNFLTAPHVELSRSNVDTIASWAYDWFCMPSISGKDPDKQTAMFYFGLGRSQVFRLEKGRWVDEQVPLELPPDTLVYAEMANELRGEWRSQHKTHALHILDAYLLGGVDISHMHLVQRSAKIVKFCSALRKPRGQHFAQVRAKNLYSLENQLEARLCSSLEFRKMKNGSTAMAYAPLQGTNLNEHASDEPYYFVMNSILFLKGTAHPWSRHLSHTTGHKYYFNSKTNEKLYGKEMRANADASFQESFSKRIIWYWPPTGDLTKDDVLDMVRAKCRRK